jgi:hypothetical protein
MQSLAAALFKRRSADVSYIDPHFASVVLLLHMDGSNGSTTFTDSSTSAKTVTANGNAQISTTNPKFGTGRCELDGANDYLTLADSNDWNFGSLDFTVEGWIYPDSVSSEQWIVAQWESSAGLDTNSAWLVRLKASGVLEALGRDVSSTFTCTSATSTVTTGSWQHVAFCRDGTTLRLYRQGGQVATAAVGSATLNNSNLPLYFGVRHTDLTFDYDGGLDDWRITKGVCRYPSGTTFTPPNAPFPNS